LNTSLTVLKPTRDAQSCVSTKILQIVEKSTSMHTKKNKMIVVQCWDDAPTNDRQLTEIFRKYSAKATFNLNPAKYTAKSRPMGWRHKDTEVCLLGWDDMKEVYADFTIANHTFDHAWLDQISPEQVYQEIFEGRERLRQFFQQPIAGFVYPFGMYPPEAIKVITEIGHVYGRTTGKGKYGRSADSEKFTWPIANPAVFHPTCHFRDEKFWELYEKSREVGVFYFWGHSYEIISKEMWQQFESVIARISADESATWSEVYELFTPSC